MKYIHIYRYFKPLFVTYKSSSLSHLFYFYLDSFCGDMIMSGFIDTLWTVKQTPLSAATWRVDGVARWGAASCNLIWVSTLWCWPSLYPILFSLLCILLCVYILAKFLQPTHTTYRICTMLACRIQLDLFLQAIKRFTFGQWGRVKSGHCLVTKRCPLETLISLLSHTVCAPVAVWQMIKLLWWFMVVSCTVIETPVSCV